MTAKEMFEKLGYEYKFVKGDCCEDTIQYFNLYRTKIGNYPILPNIQFNLIGKCIVINDVKFICIELLQAINKQIEELGWLDE